jgi:hypothetical protein
VHPYTPERNAEEKRPAPRTDEEALELLRERVPDPPSFWDPAVEYQLLRKAGAPVEEAAGLAGAGLPGKVRTSENDPSTRLGG